MTPSAFVGIDIGGTKTAIAVQLGADGEITLHERSSGDWDASQPERAARDILALIATVLPPEPRPTAVGIGAQGCNTAAQCGRLQAALAGLGMDAVVVNDSWLVVPAAGLTDGIAVIAGTGAIATGKDRDGRPMFAGGWGWVLGDDAGAAGLVREATKAALAAADRGLADDGLLAALARGFDVDDAAALARAVNDEPTVERWAPRAPAVFAAADAGSARAASVIDAGARHLAELVGVLLARGAVGSVAVAGGGVIVNQPRMFERFRARLGETCPAIEALRLDVPPVVGALALARASGRRSPRVATLPVHGEEAGATASTR
jgi:N-acetylglucosamine kinase-like BadF-type ATPase